jgi:hypothetical protein
MTAGRGVPAGIDNVLQGYYGEGLVAAIATAAGLDVQFPRLGHKVDLGIYDTGLNGSSSGSRQMMLQVKTWANGTISPDGHLHFPLEVPAFNYLAGGDHEARHYLVVCLVPGDSDDFARSTDTEVRLRRAAYWFSLRDHRPDPALTSSSTKTVLVPRTQLLTPVTMRALLANDEHRAVVP